MQQKKLPLCNKRGCHSCHSCYSCPYYDHIIKGNFFQLLFTGKGSLTIAKQTKLKPYISNLTAKGYSSLFTGKDGRLELCFINEEHLSKTTIYDNGHAILNDKKFTPLDFTNILQPITQTKIDLPLMQSIYSVFYQSVIDGKGFFNGTKLTIKRSVLASYMGIKIDIYHYTDFMAKIRQFNNVYGYFGSGKIKKFLTLTSYEEETDILQFDVTLLCEIVNTIRAEQEIKIKKPFKKEFIQELPSHSFLIHSDINRKNKNAYFLVTQIEVLLVQAGDNVKDPHIRFDTLIQRVPTLWAVLESEKSLNYKNMYLKRAFTKMYALIKNHTDLYEYFIDLHIPEIIPTQGKLDEVLQITHSGINKAYKQK